MGAHATNTLEEWQVPITLSHKVHAVMAEDL